MKLLNLIHDSDTYKKKYVGIFAYIFTTFHEKIPNYATYKKSFIYLYNIRVENLQEKLWHTQCAQTHLQN